MPGSAHIVLVGMMGAGKSTLGRALASRLGVEYADNDDGLRARTGLDAAAFASELGVELLHRIESEVLEAALARADRCVVGAAGSVAFDPRAPRLLAGQHVVWLRARVDTIAARVAHDPARPLLGRDLRGSLAGLLAEREPGFARLACVTLDVDGVDLATLVDRVLKALGAV